MYMFIVSIELYLQATRVLCSMYIVSRAMFTSHQSVMYMYIVSRAMFTSHQSVM